MIVITLPKGAEPGNPADEKYQNVTRVYDDQLDGNLTSLLSLKERNQERHLLLGMGSITHGVV